MAGSADVPSVPQHDETSRGNRAPLQVRRAFTRGASGHGVRLVSRFQAGKLPGADQGVHGAIGVGFTWNIDCSGTPYAQHLKVDDRWSILLDRGLDIWHHFDSNDTFSIEDRMPEMRCVKAFEITYMKVGQV